MPFSDKGSAHEDVEALVDTFTIDATANISNLTNNDYQKLAQLSQELRLDSDEMETEDSEVIVETMENEESVEEEVIHEEIGAHEIEIETERVPTPEEILPDVVKSATKANSSTPAAAVPPLRPLTIAPKPTKITMKPITATSAGGAQQVLLFQGTGSNQAIKLVSTQGQELNLANFSLPRPVAIKPAGKTQIVPSKMVMKKIVSTQHQHNKGTAQTLMPTISSQKNQIVVLQKGGDQVKILPNTTKTITLQQAQEMGLLPTTTTTTKILTTSQTTLAPKKSVVVNKSHMKTIKIVPQLSQAQILTSSGTPKTITTIKSPTKILPATAVTPTISSGKLPQRIIFKNAATGSGGHAILPQAQLIQVAGSQTIASGQIHQINIPGKGPQLIKFVTASGADTIPTTAIKTNVAGTAIAQPTNIILSEIKNTSGVSTIAPKPLKTLASKAPPTITSQQQVVVIPNFIQQKVPIPMRHTTQKVPVSVSVSISPDSSGTVVVAATTPTTPTTAVAAAAAATTTTTTTIVETTNLESNGMRPRKPCNCTKSQCLKLYCDCFANGEFCYMCNCMNCFNNLENEDHRQRAIKTCLERNPTAFRPKIGKAKDHLTGDTSIRKHTKGCNCKRSGCLKNYCECYEAKIACSNNCKCVGCRNIEDSMDKKSLRTSASLDENTLNTLIGAGVVGAVTIGAGPNQPKLTKDITTFRTPRRTSNTKHPINFITDDVIEATTQCMLTISDSGETNMQDEDLTKTQIIQEFGRCLTEIINCSSSPH